MPFLGFLCGIIGNKAGSGGYSMMEMGFMFLCFNLENPRIVSIFLFLFFFFFLRGEDKNRRHYKVIGHIYESL